MNKQQLQQQYEETKLEMKLKLELIKSSLEAVEQAKKDIDQLGSHLVFLSNLYKDLEEEIGDGQKKYKS